MGRRTQGLYQKKSLSQVFLRTDWPIHRVLDKLDDWDIRRVVEVGPGGGVMTRQLLDSDIKVTAVEKDHRFADALVEYNNKRDPDRPGKLEVVNQDALKFDLAEWIRASDEVNGVVGNIPYNISSQIVMWLLEEIDNIVGACLMVQLEFGERLASQPGNKSYGSLSVYSQLRSKIEMVCKVDRTCFQPIPKVDSAIISFKPRTNKIPEKLLKKVELITRTAFSQRRKMLRNAVSRFIDEAAQKDCPIDLNRRPDSLRPDEYLELAEYIFPDDITD